MTPADLIGYAAGALTTAAFLPQVAKTWMSRSARDLSLAWLLVFFAGVLLWLIYGLLIWAWPVILPNLVTLALVGALLALKLAERARPPSA